MCKTGGRLIGTVPAFQFLWSRRDIDLHHKRRYTLEEIKGRIEKAGFTILTSQLHQPSVLFPLLMLVKTGQLSQRTLSIKLDYALVPPVINRLLAHIIEYEARLIRHTDLPIGTSIVCVALKKAPAEASLQTPPFLKLAA